MQPGETEIARALEQAVALHRGGRVGDAEKVYRKVLEHAPDHPEALNLLGLVHYQKRDAAGAVQLIQRAVAADDRPAKYHANLGTAFAALGRNEDAEVAFRDALARDPEHAESHANLGAVLERSGDVEGAIFHCRRAAELRPGSAVAHNNLGNALQMQGDQAAAVEAYESAVAIEPSYVEAFCNLGMARLRLRDPRGAGEAFGSALALNPTNRRALAWQAVAEHEAGAPQSPLVRINESIESMALYAPPPFESVDAFDAALAHEVTGHPSLAWEPGGKTTKNGRQTGNLLEAPGEAVRALELAIQQAVEAYISRQRTADLDGYFAQVPERRTLRMWGTVLADQGHQLAHIHPAGWISGVYYVAVPDTITADDPEHAGWIEFGRPGYDVPCERPVEPRLLRPEAGTVVLFPSFAFHRTVPFASPEGRERISIAFDVYGAD